MVIELKPGLTSSLDNLDQASSHLAKITERLDVWTTGNDKQMNAFMGDGLGQVPALLEDARATLREVEKLISDLREDPSVLIYKPNESDVDVEK
jgi:ABC-type transporter Mla subunit MlaD